MASSEEMDQKKYTYGEAMALLGISKSTLEEWITKAKLRNIVKKQYYPDDMRQHYLLQPQLELLAAAHRRQLATPATIDSLARLEAVAAALTERIEALEQRVAKLESQVDATSAEDQG
jgi:polyhydroxyalkanoate synthesis regulator phasin